MATCVICQDSLTIHIGDQEKDEQSGGPSEVATCVDDDVQLLACNCHFHWQCLLDSSYNVTDCPNCKAEVVNVNPTGVQQLLCNLNNEGGLQESQDILPILTEESYLKAYPEERKARAFLEFAAEGDVEAIVEMLSVTAEDLVMAEGGTETHSVSSNEDMLRYQDQLGSMKSALHLAVEHQRFEVAWLLLLLASNVDLSVFPSQIVSAAEAMEISRTDQTGRVDIRALKDAEGMTAYERARGLGGAWESWVTVGTFSSEPLLKSP